MKPEKTIKWKGETDHIDIICPNDRTVVTLYYNGGELDDRKCPSCGRYFVASHVRTVVKIYPPGTSSIDTHKK